MRQQSGISRSRNSQSRMWLVRYGYSGLRMFWYFCQTISLHFMTSWLGGIVPALFYHGGEVEARGTEEERVDVAQGVARVEALVVDDGRGDYLLSEAEVLAAQVLDKVGKEDVDFVEVLGGLEGGQISLAAQFDLLLVQ